MPKFSALPSASALAGADIFCVDQGGVSKQTTVSQLTIATGTGNVNYPILATDRVVYTNAAFSAARTWTLPTAAAYGGGRVLTLEDAFGTITATNTLSIARSGSDTINGSASSIILNGAFDSISLISDGVSRWGVVSSLQAVAAVAKNWLTAMDSYGNFTQSQPATGDLSCEPSTGNAAAGAIGQHITATVVQASGVALTNAVAANITSISLTAGDWDVSGSVSFHISTGLTSSAFFAGGTSLTTAVTELRETGKTFAVDIASKTQGPGYDYCFQLSPVRYSLASTQSVFLNGYIEFSAGTWTAYGFIRARRVR